MKSLELAPIPIGVASIVAAKARASAVSIFFITEADEEAVLTLAVVGGRMWYPQKDDYCHGNIRAAQYCRHDKKLASGRCASIERLK